MRRKPTTMRQQQLRLSFQPPTTRPAMPLPAQQRCRELLSRMLVHILRRELRPEENHHELEDSTDPR